MKNFNEAEEGMIDSGKVIQDFVLKYAKKFHWFILGLLISLPIAYIKIKKLIPNYEISATILIKDDSNGSLLSETSPFQDLGYGNMYYPIENEIEILKSRSLMQKVVGELKLNVSLYKEAQLKIIDLFKKEPFKITFLSGDSSIYNSDALYFITPISDKQFIFEDPQKKKVETGNFGSSFETGIGNLILTPTNFLREGEKYILQINSFESTVNQFAGAITVEKVNDYSNVINIVLDDPSEFKALAVVNALIHQHQRDAVKDKNQVAQNSANFINERINYITKELNLVEDDVQQYKSSHNVFDVITEKDIFLESKNENEKKIVDNEIQLKLVEYVRSYIDNQNDASVLIPNNIGLSENSIQQQIDVYNSLVLERNRVLKTSSDKNPVAINLESKILSLQVNLRESLQKVESRVKLERNQLEKQGRNLSSQIGGLPRKEKELREIQRQQQIKETLYLYLLQKREETAITLSLTVPNSKIIDEAYCKGVTFNPSKKTILLMAILIGLIVPFAVLFILDKFNYKVNSKKEIESLGLGILSEIPKARKDENKLLFAVPTGRQEDRSHSPTAEAFRLLRTNLDFVLSQSESKCKFIFITSSIPSEGKSYISVNLAKSISLLDKKVAVVGLDLRSPKLAEYLKIDAPLGITHFIVDKQLPIDAIIYRSNDLSFDVVCSGEIPPNPSELLTNKRLSELFAHLRSNYDYVVIDTPPVTVVSDTLLVASHADLFLFVVRENFTPRYKLADIVKLKKENRLPNLYVLLNYSKSTFSYGYSPYYGYGGKKKGFKSRFS